MPHYSHRLPWSIQQNSFTRLIRDKQHSGVELLDLTLSNPTVSPWYPHAQIGECFSAGQEFTYSPDPFGSENARKAIAHSYAEQGYSVSPSHIALTASTSEAYAVLFKLLCDPGDEILIPVPSYPLFEYLAAFDSVRTVPYSMHYDGSWYVDFASLRERITPRSRAIVIVNPNNPTGSFLKKHEWEMLAEIAREQDLAIISDEVFMRYELGSSRNCMKTVCDQTEVMAFSLNGLSKMAGMPQMKLGWIVVSGPEAQCGVALQHLELVLDTYLSVNAPVQTSLASLLDVGAAIRAELRRISRLNLAEAEDQLIASPVHLLHAEGGWSVILQLPRTRTEEEWTTVLLAEENVILQPGFFFDMPGEAYAVASLIVEPKAFGDGIRRLRSLAERSA